MRSELVLVLVVCVFHARNIDFCQSNIECVCASTSCVCVYVSLDLNLLLLIAETRAGSL